MEALKNWVFSISSIIILFTLIEIMIPSEKFKKIIKLVNGLVLVIVIINPIIKTVEDGQLLNRLTLDAYSSIENYDIKSNELSNLQEKQIIELYEKKLKQQIIDEIFLIDGIKSVDVYINIERDTKSESFGLIKELKLDIEFEKYVNNTIDSVSINFDDDSHEEIQNIIKKKMFELYKVREDKIAIVMH